MKSDFWSDSRVLVEGRKFNGDRVFGHFGDFERLVRKSLSFNFF